MSARSLRSLVSTLGLAPSLVSTLRPSPRFQLFGFRPGLPRTKLAAFGGRVDARSDAPRRFLTRRRPEGGAVLTSGGRRPKRADTLADCGAGLSLQESVVRLSVDDVELPSGARIEYGVLESGGFAAVVPVTSRGDVVLVRQWRQPLGAFTLELPSGGVERARIPRSRRGGSSSRRRATGPRLEHLASCIRVRAEHGGLPPFPVLGGEGRARPHPSPRSSYGWWGCRSGRP